MKNIFHITLTAVCIVFFGGVIIPPAITFASADGVVDFLDDDFYEIEPDSVEQSDPLESFNRAMFTFNDYTYTWVYDPVTRGYSYVVPKDIRKVTANFFYNVQEPVRCVNALLQGRFSDAGTLFMRFVINTTGGVFGFGDLAGEELGFKAVDATLGETLGVWGVGDGFYLVVPFYGSTTLRDFTGTMFDDLIYYIWADTWVETSAIYMGKELNYLSLHLGEYEDLKKLSFDPYIAVRNGYFQYRKKIRDYTPEEER